MKELKYKKNLDKQLKNINDLYERINDSLTYFILIGSIGLGVFLTLSLGEFILTIYSIIVLVCCSTKLLSIFKGLYNKIVSKKNLDELVDILEENNISVNKDSLKKTICVEQVKDQSKKENNKNKEIIKHYYMLDKKDQIRVLRETINYYAFFNKIEKNRSVCLLEEEDLNDIIMPTIEKSLKMK